MILFFLLTWVGGDFQHLVITGRSQGMDHDCPEMLDGHSTWSPSLGLFKAAVVDSTSEPVGKSFPKKRPKRRVWVRVVQGLVGAYTALYSLAYEVGHDFANLFGGEEFSTEERNRADFGFYSGSILMTDAIFRGRRLLRGSNLEAHLKLGYDWSTTQWIVGTRVRF